MKVGIIGRNKGKDFVDLAAQWFDAAGVEVVEIPYNIQAKDIDRSKPLPINLDELDEIEREKLHVKAQELVESAGRIVREVDMLVIPGMGFSPQYFDLHRRDPKAVKPLLEKEAREGIRLPVLNEFARFEVEKIALNHALGKAKLPMLALCGGAARLRVHLEPQVRYEKMPPENLRHHVNGHLPERSVVLEWKDSLKQHLPHDNFCASPFSEKHGGKAHTITVLPNSLLGRMVARHHNGSGNDGLMDNKRVPYDETTLFSIHGERSLSPFSEILRPVAWAPDGIIEAFEVKNHPFALGIAGHPEMGLDSWLMQDIVRQMKQQAERNFSRPGRA